MEFERQLVDGMRFGALAASLDRASKDSRRHSGSLRYCKSLHMVMSGLLRFVTNLRNCGSAVNRRHVSCVESEREDSNSKNIGCKIFSLLPLQALGVFRIGLINW